MATAALLDAAITAIAPPDVTIAAPPAIAAAAPSCKAGLFSCAMCSFGSASLVQKNYQQQSTSLSEGVRGVVVDVDGRCSHGAVVARWLIVPPPCAMRSWGFFGSASLVK